MNNILTIAEQSKSINSRDKSTWIELYYSFAHDSVHTKPGEDRFFVTYLINPNTPEDIRNAVNRWKNSQKGANMNTYKTIEENYCESSDITFLMEYTYHGDAVLEKMEVIGFYCGEPNEAHTKYFSENRRTTATYDDIL